MHFEEEKAGAAPSLREYLLGTWALESYLELAADGSVANAPFGADASGLLIYASDGFMSAFLMPAARRLFASGDWFSPTSEEAVAASRVIAYSGRYRVDEVAGTVTHEVELSFFPNWSGQNQVRRAERAVLLWSAAVAILYPLAALHLWSVAPVVFAVGLGGALAPVLQTRLMDVAGEAQSLAAALNHSAFNVANALGPWLGGIAIGAGLGWTSTGWVAAAMALGGLAIWAVTVVVNARYYRR